MNKILRDSIKKLGLLEPIAVLEVKANKRYEVLDGAKRLKCIKSLNRKTIYAIVYKFDNDGSLVRIPMKRKVNDACVLLTPIRRLRASCIRVRRGYVSTTNKGNESPLYYMIVSMKTAKQAYADYYKYGQDRWKYV